jgi:CheY-like chemotaxis protein
MKRKTDLNILYVDDDEDYIKYLKRDIGKIFNIDVARDKYECLDRIGKDKKKYNIILLDLYWPKDGKQSHDEGYAILNEIRKLYSPQELPVIIYTQRGNEEDALWVLRNQAQDWLQKASSPAEKIWRIQRSIISQSIDKAKNYRNLTQYIFSTCIFLISIFLLITGKTIYAVVLLFPLFVANGLVQHIKVKLKMAQSTLETEIDKKIVASQDSTIKQISLDDKN